MKNFLDRYHEETFKGILSWEALDLLWDKLILERGAGWYTYTVGEAVPERPAYGEELTQFLTDVGATLRRGQRREHCGLVYVDDPESPTFVIIYNPTTIGGCGLGNGPTIPGWTITRQPPQDILAALRPDPPGPLQRISTWIRKAQTLAG